MGRQALEDVKSTDSTLHADCSTAVGLSIMCMVQLTATEQLHTHSCTVLEDREPFTHVGVLLVKSICNGGGCGLVDDAQHLQSSDGASIFCGLQ